MDKRDTFNFEYNLGKSIASIQKNPIIYIRKNLDFYDSVLNFLVTQYKQCLSFNGSIIYYNGKIEMSILIIDLNQQISFKQHIYSWTSVTLPKLFSVKELYFLVASPETEAITLNPVVTKGGWLTCSFSYPSNFSDTYASTGVFSIIYMLPFIPYTFPASYVEFLTTCDSEIKNDYGTIEVIKQRDFLFLGIIQNLTWKFHRSPRDLILKAMFFGEWLHNEIPEDCALKIFNNTRFSIQHFDFSINIQNIHLSKNKKLFGSLSTVSCDQMPPNLTPGNMPTNLIIQFELVTVTLSPEHLMFSCNPKLFFTGDVLNHSVQLQHNPNYYEMIVYAPYNLHFYPSRYHIVTFPIQYSTKNNRQILITGHPNEGYFEVQLCPWMQNSPLQIIMRSFSQNLILPQGTPIAILLYMEKMTPGKHGLRDQEFKINGSVTRIGNMNLPKENFLHYDC
ncbi:protein UL31 [macacine betaherpesvirus 9]|uniref:Protein UL31 n=1 Tax=macacine betaherpesvirus 9 TaxID=2560568 RepID=A0A191S3U2_9BETA|nr:protein UL31 [macacine betaherpesvirus 9]ANC96548.1 protein UL31 [macacine betaherpesvirus 9]